MEIKAGDWVEIDGYKGYYKILKFVDWYAPDDIDYCDYRKGQYFSTVAILKQGFTSTMKLKLTIWQVDVELLIKLPNNKFEIIQRYWKEHPVDLEKYQAYTVGNEMGYHLMEISVRPKELEYWKIALERLPQKFNMRQFDGWFRNTQGAILQISEEEGIKGKKSQYFITFDLVEECLAVGKAPLFNNPRIVFGR